MTKWKCSAARFTSGGCGSICRRTAETTTADDAYAMNNTRCQEALQKSSGN